MEKDPIMDLLHLVVTDDSFKPTEEREAISRRLHPPRRPSYYQRYTFDVLMDDEWCRMDVSVPQSDFYEGVPVSVQARARTAIERMVHDESEFERDTGRQTDFL